MNNLMNEFQDGGISEFCVLPKMIETLRNMSAMLRYLQSMFLTEKYELGWIIGSSLFRFRHGQ